MGRTIYVKLTALLGIAYAGMFPLAIFRDGIFWKWLLRPSEETWTEETRASIEALFLLLAALVFGGYVTAYYFNSINFTDITVMQRLTLVNPCIVLTTLLHQDPIHPRIAIAMFVADVIGGFLHGMLAPGGIKGVIGTSQLSSLLVARHEVYNFARF